MADTRVLAECGIVSPGDARRLEHRGRPESLYRSFVRAAPISHAAYVSSDTARRPHSRQGLRAPDGQKVSRGLFGLFDTSVC